MTRFLNSDTTIDARPLHTGVAKILIQYLDRHSTSSYIVKMPDQAISSDLLRGHTDTIILKLLLEDDKYGYAISKLIYDKSNKVYELKEATMYSTFRRLESGGQIRSYWGDETQGGRRKYYQITESGRALYHKNKRDWDSAKEILEQLL